jgi:GTP cyclohydrolase II
MREAVELIDATGGFLLYLRQEGRGIGLYAKLDAYVLQDAGLDTYDANLALGYCADERDYTVATQMLLALGVANISLLTNNPDKVRQLERHGVTVSSRQPTKVHLTPANSSYLAAKMRRGSHMLQFDSTLEGGPKINLTEGSLGDETGLPPGSASVAESDRAGSMKSGRARVQRR